MPFVGMPFAPFQQATFSLNLFEPIFGKGIRWWWPVGLRIRPPLAEPKIGKILHFRSPIIPFLNQSMGPISMAVSGHLIPPSYMNSYTKGELNAPKWPFKWLPSWRSKRYFFNPENGISRFSRFWALYWAGNGLKSQSTPQNRNRIASKSVDT